MSTNNRYNIYIRDCARLAATMLIKLDDVADAINQSVRYKTGYESVDLYDKSSWKYYQNISGNYHISDTMMNVTSLDDNEVINFTVENLLKHKVTKQAYQYGSRYYNELVNRYPDQESLILGILNPIDINKAINAKNGTILSYDKSLIFYNEYNLINKLQNWIDDYLFRWVNRQYILSDDLYVATYVFQLTLHLLQAIISLRLEACNTNEAHDFHIRSYLKSHGFIDQYLDALTLKQSLFYYRNIRYIEKNGGKSSTFSWVTEKTLTERQLPIYEIKVKQDVSSITTTVDSFTDIPDREIRPELVFTKDPLNPPAEASIQNPDNYNQVLDLVVNTVNGNEVYQEDHKEIIKDKLLSSGSDVVRTKLLECIANDDANVFLYTLASIVLNHWIYLSAKNRYKVVVYVNLTKDKKEIMLTAQQSVALYIYCLQRAYIYNLDDSLKYDKIPKIHVNRVARIPVPGIDDLLSVTDQKSISREEVVEMHSTHTVINEFYSIPDFNDLCFELFEKSKKQYSLYSTKENMNARAYAQSAVARLYTDETIVLDQLVNSKNEVMTYNELLDIIGINLNDYKAIDYLTLASNIAGSATMVADTEVNKLSFIQESLVSLMLKLSSYSINIVNTITNKPSRLVPTTAIRIGDIDVKTFISNYVISAPVDVIENRESEFFTIKTEEVDFVSEHPDDFNVMLNDHYQYSIDPTVDLDRRSLKSKTIYGFQSTALNNRGFFNTSGQFNDLTLEEKQHLLDLSNSVVI